MPPEKKMNYEYMIESDSNGEPKPRWWVNPPRKPSLPRKPRRKPPVTVLHGTFHQAAMGGRYAGVQCTSICLEAISWWTLNANYGDFTEVAVDYVTISGHYLHLHLREDLVVCLSYDGKVAIDDLPARCRIDGGYFYNNTAWKEYVSFTPDGEIFGDLRSLRDYLLICTDRPTGLLITIGSYTQALLYNKKKQWLVYDSQGGLEYMGRKAPYASCWVFDDDVDAVIGFLLATRDVGHNYCLVTKPFILSDDAFAPSGDFELKKARSLRRACEAREASGEAALSSSCPDKVESAQLELEEDPYVSFMGGFGG